MKEQLENQNRMMLTILIVATTVLSIKNLFLGIFLIVNYFRNDKLSYLLVGLLALGASVAFLRLRKKMVKEKI